MVASHDSSSGSLAAPSSGSRLARTDLLSDVLGMVKLSGALFFLVDASSPWGVEVPHASTYAPIILPRARHVVSYHIALEGGGWAALPDVGPVRFDAGDVLVFPHDEPYALLSSPDVRPQYDARASLDFLAAMAAGSLPFVVREGGGGEPRTRLVCGYLGCDARPFNPVLSTLPKLMLVRHPGGEPDDLLGHLIELTLAEAGSTRAGGDAIRLRLSELMFVEVVRRYLEALAPTHTGWLAGLRDPAIERVLSLLHADPAHPWSLHELADRAALSRATLAERFAHLVGFPPMQYLALWRMQIAARRLADTATKVAAVAHEVGYESEAAFSRAFKKATGVPPAQWRERHALPHDNPLMPPRARPSAHPEGATTGSAAPVAPRSRPATSSRRSA